jgi:hypothetical protein
VFVRRIAAVAARRRTVERKEVVRRTERDWIPILTEVEAGAFARRDSARKPIRPCARPQYHAKLMPRRDEPSKRFAT